MRARRRTRFKPLGNMGCRNWWGRGDLRDRDLGGHAGGWLMGINGPRRGRFDIAFESWCRNRAALWVRTVDLFWAFEYHRKGFPHRLDLSGLRRNWQGQIDHRRQVAAALLSKDYECGADGWIRVVRLPAYVPGQVAWGRLTAHEREHLDYYDPHPGPWQAYFRREKKYFEQELDRYRRVLRFWHRSGPELRRAFKSCAAYSNRRAETHPDYLVVSHSKRGSAPSFGFVEVKGPRESLRSSQRRFFPELVRCAGQSVWVARCYRRESPVAFRFGRFGPAGQIIASNTLFGRPTEN